MSVPSISRRLACLVYESLLLLAVWFFSGFLVVALLHHLDESWRGLVMQAWLFLVSGLYFTWFWRYGQTLAMKTWRIRLEAADGGPMRYSLALKRFFLACLLIPVGWLWALFAKDGQFLHDRLAGTRLVNASGIRE